MALQRMIIDGYGQLELNQCAFRRDGRIEAQCKLNEEQFKQYPAENGMILDIDNVTREIYLPEGIAGSADRVLGLVYSTEHMYDERMPGLKNFKNGYKEFYPRLGYLDVGDKFTTNCVSFDTDEFADQKAFIEALKNAAETRLYGTTSQDGSIKVTATVQPGCLKLQVRSLFTMPDGQPGIRFQVLALAA